MPTQIAIPPKESWMAATAVVVIGSLLAAIIIGGIDVAIVWAYANL